MNPLTGLGHTGAPKSAIAGEAEKEVGVGEEKASADTKVDNIDTVVHKKSSYLVLGQEDYKEHRAPVNLLTLSSVGGKVASCDSSGVIKVWWKSKLLAKKILDPI